MESVLLGRDATAEPRPPQLVAGALAVRNVQQRWRGARILPAADKVRGTTGAAVERVAGTADNPRELLAHAPQPRNAGMRASISSIFAAIRTRSASDGDPEWRAAYATARRQS